MFVELMTKAPAHCQDEDVQKLRDAGWTDPQIAEGVYITALFAFFNRVADAFGLPAPDYDFMLKKQESKEKVSPDPETPPEKLES